jgi:hypothetical protein
MSEVWGEYHSADPGVAHLEILSGDAKSVFQCCTYDSFEVIEYSLYGAIVPGVKTCSMYRPPDDITCLRRIP